MGYPLIILWFARCYNIKLQCARQLSVQFDKLDLISRDQTISHRNTELIDINIHTIQFTFTPTYSPKNLLFSILPPEYSSH